MTSMPFLKTLAGLLSTAYSDSSDRTTSSSYLQIQIPSTLNRAGGYDHREAFFGTYPYGSSITQPLYYADDDLCDATVDRRKGYPVRPRDDGGGEMEPWKPPFILMVDRGRCTFVEKVRNAQHSGAAAVVIADDKCLCDDTKCIEADRANDDDPSSSCERTEPVMFDDGSGGDITIPTMLLSKHDADSIKNVLYDDSTGVVQMRMRWYLPGPDDRVEYELWSTPTDVAGREFVKEGWKDVAVGLGGGAYFTPRQYLWDGRKARCRTASGANMCYSLCTNSGRYCALDPDRDMDNGISGANVVNESLRRICIWKNYGEADGIGAQYWDYLGEFIARCDTPEKFAQEKCIIDVYKAAKIDGGIIRDCMTNSGGTIGNTDNNLLDLELKTQEERNVVVLPTLFVNNMMVRGKLNSKNVMNAVCAGYLDGTEPAICGSGGSVRPPPSYSNDDDIGGSVNISKGSFGLTLLLTCSMFAVGAHLYRRRANESMQNEVRGILSEYMPLEGGDDNGRDGSMLEFARSNGGNL